MGILLDQINDRYNQMCQATDVVRPFCKGKPITKPWVILALRSEETERLVEPLYVDALQANARGLSVTAQNLFDCILPLALITEGLAYASSGYERIEDALIALQNERLIHPDSVPGLVTLLGITEATKDVYKVVVSILETVDREQMAKDPIYAAQELETVRDLIDYGRTIDAVGKAAMAWVESARLLQAARQAPSAVLANSPSQGSVS